VSPKTVSGLHVVQLNQLRPESEISPHAKDQMNPAQVLKLSQWQRNGKAIVRHERSTM
jgi:hypothetical protein